MPIQFIGIENRHGEFQQIQQYAKCTKARNGSLQGPLLSTSNDISSEDTNGPYNHRDEFWKLSIPQNQEGYYQQQINLACQIFQV